VGEAEVLAEGPDGLVVAVGTRVHAAAAAVAAQAEKGRRFGLVNLRFVKPLDTGTILAQLPADRPLVVVEEGSRMGGIGEAIAVAALHHGWHGPFVHLGIPDSFPEQGSQGEILRDLGLDADGIARALSRL
jgi:1-deoxy-D-xylulose-5-phosphate synthase